MKIGNLNELEGWFEFKTEVMKYFPNFFDLLQQNHPDLKSDEIKICALLFLDCRTKEIAKHLEKEPHSIDEARSRLRDEFKLQEKDSLNAYLKALK